MKVHEIKPNSIWIFGMLGEIVGADYAVTLDTQHLTQQEWEWIHNAHDGWRQDIAVACFVRSWYRYHQAYTESQLPCQWCKFVPDETTPHGWVWLTCNDPAQPDTAADGCDGGNR
jgi:hypothetical protein